MIKIKIKKNLFFFVTTVLCCLSNSHLDAETDVEETEESTHSIHFVDVPMTELIRYVGRISGVSFIFDNKAIEFNVTFSTGKPMTSQHVLQALIQMLRMRGFSVEGREHYYVIHKAESGQPAFSDKFSDADVVLPGKSAGYQFFLYKLKYHQGSEIEESIKKIAADLQSKPESPKKLLSAIQSMQWVKATNSLLCSGDEETLADLRRLVDSLDVALRQVFIEVLVVETDLRQAMEFGLEWALGGKVGNIGFGAGNFAEAGAFAHTLKGINAVNPPTGLGQIPLGRGFDMGVIGDIILHKGKSYLSLGSLVSALQLDGESTIVLNQKIITQDNKNSTIFVGDNIPYTGSVVQTVGQSQQTTSNIEYRDIGVSLSITPMLGEDNIVTMDLNEEITESVMDKQSINAGVNGIRTTKTNMVTHVHVPDKHFLVLSGMVRNAKANHKTGLPCLGGLPVIGALFSKTKKQDEKRNVMIFVRPHIIHSFEDYKRLTQSQEGAPANVQ